MLKYLLFLLLVGCAGVNVDPELKPYVDEFDQETSARSYVNMVFEENVTGKTGKTVAGVCRYSGNIFIPNTVAINKGYWDTIPVPMRKSLVWHELGHCVLGLDHNEDLTPEGYPASVMYPSVIPGYIWEMRFDTYREEMSTRVTIINRLLQTTSKSPGVQVH